MSKDGNKFSGSKKTVDDVPFSFLAPITFVVARRLWHNGNFWLCCPIFKENSSILCIHPEGLARKQQFPNHYRDAISVAHTLCTSTAASCCHISLSCELLGQLEYHQNISISFRLILDESINSLYLSGLRLIIRTAIRLSISLQQTTLTSIKKNLTRSFWQS